MQFSHTAPGWTQTWMHDQYSQLKSFIVRDQTSFFYFVNSFVLRHSVHFCFGFSCVFCKALCCLFFIIIIITTPQMHCCANICWLLSATSHKSLQLHCVSSLNEFNFYAIPQWVTLQFLYRTVQSNNAMRLQCGINWPLLNELTRNMLHFRIPYLKQQLNVWLTPQIFFMYPCVIYLAVENKLWRLLLIFHVPYQSHSIWLMGRFFITVVWRNQQLRVL